MQYCCSGRGVCLGTCVDMSSYMSRGACSWSHLAACMMLDVVRVGAP